MGFLNFFVRLLKPLIIITLLAGGLIGTVYLLSILFRETWEAFETNLKDQTKWMLERVKFWQPWKFWAMMIALGAMLVCGGLWLGFVFFSGSGAEGNLLP